MKKALPSILIGFGALFLVASLIFGWWGFPKLMENKITQQVRLEPSSITYDKWRNITTPIFIRYHIFNVTNPEEVAKGQKPVVEEIGPFVYEQKRLKNITSTDEESDTLTYQQSITYFYRQDLSKDLPEDTKLTILNIPLAALRTRPKVFRNIAKEFFVGRYNESLFIERTVREFLFDGYIQESLRDLSQEDLKNEPPILPDNKFALYYGKNGTFGNEFTVHRGVRDSNEFGWITKWDKKDKLPWWGGETCNMINGTDGSIFPPFVTKDRIVRLFSEELCRSVFLTYQKDVEFRGIPGYRFTLPQTLLARASENPDNLCFCEGIAHQEINTAPPTEEDKEFEDEFKGGFFDTDSEEEKKEPTPEELEAEKAKAEADLKRIENAKIRQCSAGIIHLSACRDGRPLAASTPHFLYGEQMDVDNVGGLEPIEEKHETLIDIEPMTGLVLQASKKIQLNVEIGPIYSYDKVPQVYLPILWADEYAAMTPDKANEFKAKVIKVLSIADVSRWIVLGVSSCLIIFGIAVLVLRARNTKHFA